MDYTMKHIVLQLEMLLEEYPEAKFYVQDRVKEMVRDLLNAEDCKRELQQQESEI
jgi:hypothetical protein